MTSVRIEPARKCEATIVCMALLSASAGKTEALRFKENGQYLRSFVGDNSLFIDVMMNVGIIFYAARETGDRRLIP